MKIFERSKFFEIRSILNIKFPIFLESLYNHFANIENLLEIGRNRAIEMERFKLLFDT